ncbi:MAG: hypothetical protein OJF52_004064 [Nitrospira sp.]|nr:MAG: hypothetical protein OJF52_004064 [Nitrospira sp.]
MQSRCLPRVAQWYNQDPLPMIIPPPSDLAHYRVTFFFGPEAVEHRPDHLRCVFNVKKRSWKGGVQVAVDVARNHLTEIRERIGYQASLGEILQSVGQEDRDDLMRRTDDLFVQALCACKLNLALRAGLEQDNQIIAAEAFSAELDRLIDEEPDRIIDRIRLELDLGEVSDV